ncbi:PAS domain-containing sensor histidine kinase [Mucilaginibacter auburnensis]|uniref:histidine kinase n=1 Tax=Mucilaginibacter auburnensis TaxID=1457233 RepID=A0A2H9VST6_9SPHI|nr:PAS domain-containing sensor histidine kinase [Mucilaginibacter auburnensis]PJJ83891.1 PAS domain S-box-containing protein [Mucilaginibacter auburnensis]
MNNIIKDIAGLGSWHYDVTTKSLQFDQETLSLVGLSQDSGYVNKNGYAFWLDNLHPGDRANAVATFKTFTEDEAQQRYEQTYRFKHSSGKWIWLWSKAMRYVTGNIAGTITDISFFKKEIEQSRVESKLLRTLIDSLPDVIYVKDDKGRKIIANHADVASLGLTSEEEVVGKTDIELLKGDVGERCYHDDMHIIDTGEPIVNMEEFFFDADGNKQWLLTTKVPVKKSSGKTSHILGIGHNITHRKQNEESLKLLNEELSEQAEELRALNEQLTLQKEQETEKAIAQGKFEIASEILHDIGNALVGFGAYLNRINRLLERGNLKALKNLALFISTQQSVIAQAIGVDKANALVSLTETMAKTQTESDAELTNSVNELLNITTHIQEILNIQRQFVGGHSGIHQRKPVNLINIINDCRSMLMASMDKKGIQLTTSIEPGNYVIKGDHTKLMQVILNVLKNSVEAIDLEARQKQISINLHNKAGAITLSIKDNGKGFNEETGQHLFERGYTTKSNGTGLGLYNCRSIIESHAGQFNISSGGLTKGAEVAIVFEADQLESREAAAAGAAYNF